MRGNIMGKVSGNWITGVHSGRACRHDDIYTKVNKKTGACYSVKLCNPNTAWSEKVEAQRNSFGAISSAICEWIKVEKEKNSADYQKVKKNFDRQVRFATLRGYMFAKGCTPSTSLVSCPLTSMPTTMPLLHLAVLAAHRLLILAAHRLHQVAVTLKTQETAKVAATLLAALNTSKL